MPISILKISSMYPIKLYIVYFDINLHIFIVSHQEHSFAPKGCGLAVRSILFCCCSINRCSRSLLLCSRSTLVGSLKSFIASTSQPAVFSSHSSNSFWTYDRNVNFWRYISLFSRLTVGTGSMAMNFAMLREGVISYTRSKSKTFSVFIEATVPELALELPQKSWAALQWVFQET